MEIEKNEGIAEILNREFAKINSTLKVLISENPSKVSQNSAIVENGNRFSQINIIEEEKIYRSDFWRDGVYLASGKAPNITEFVKALDYWLCQDVTTKMFSEKFKFINTSERSFAFDEGREIEYQWEDLLQDNNDWNLREFVSLAINDEILSNLFPFTSHGTLCFSKCTGYPYDYEGLPHVTPKEFEKKSGITNEKQFIVTINNMEYLGEGNAVTALKIVKANLPKGLERARKGVAKD
ncbi:hypothetical protein C8C83_5116 [Flavobacterium sp. 90]|uniref:DUF6193 family natural product biosynthesis protein n=1 Tax=unclassified Flavobacterium TaxID=196869 RepID=UPI000EB384C4|nr:MULTISPECIES: DUF6193 family natural product biosynthesis protein [unclassified Flavobacterium]RKR05767.1 hypothetical protein C8C82_5463 [Flavobacterium sp. 81]TCK57077.1 hypothetical protein C8C83_5116 [Flavobacterium sp. 90]